MKTQQWEKESRGQERLEKHVVKASDSLAAKLGTAMEHGAILQGEIEGADVVATGIANANDGADWNLKIKAKNGRESEFSLTTSTLYRGSPHGHETVRARVWAIDPDSGKEYGMYSHSSKGIDAMDTVGFTLHALEAGYDQGLVSVVPMPNAAVTQQQRVEVV
jgi:hypothetical protein